MVCTILFVSGAKVCLILVASIKTKGYIDKSKGEKPNYQIIISADAKGNLIRFNTYFLVTWEERPDLLPR